MEEKTPIQIYGMRVIIFKNINRQLFSGRDRIFILPFLV